MGVASSKFASGQVGVDPPFATRNSQPLINGKTQLLGLFGWPVSHSFSPAMHNAALAAAELNYVYLPLSTRPDQLKTAVSALSALNFRGVNVTVPHKQAIIPLLDEIDPAAAAIGAVNTVIVSDDGHGNARLLGKNSDWLGFMADLAALNVDVRGRDCVIFGAGGSARAVAYGLVQAGAMVHIVARRPAQAEELVAAMELPRTSIAVATMDDVVALSAPLLVNSTPLGMHPHEDGSVWGTKPFPSNAFAYDLVYNPTETLFMRQARAAGCGAANGLGMLLRQGAIAFEWWTGVTPDVNVMQAAFENR